MALIKTGGGVTDIRGGFGGTYFTRDKTGLHQSAKPRRVRQRTAAQNVQRAAFSKARSFSKINRVVSYNIYRALNDLYVGFFYDVTGELTPDSTGHYTRAGTNNGRPYYRRENGAWFIWWGILERWVITAVVGTTIPTYWERLDPNVVGIYLPKLTAIGTATIALASTIPPPDYQPPHLQEPNP